jgi:hypothetical protein
MADAKYRFGWSAIDHPQLSSSESNQLIIIKPLYVRRRPRKDKGILTLPDELLLEILMHMSDYDTFDELTYISFYKTRSSCRTFYARGSRVSALVALGRLSPLPSRRQRIALQRPPDSLQDR